MLKKTVFLLKRKEKLYSAAESRPYSHVFNNFVEYTWLLICVLILVVHKTVFYAYERSEGAWKCAYLYLGLPKLTTHYHPLSWSGSSISLLQAISQCWVSRLQVCGAGDSNIIMRSTPIGRFNQNLCTVALNTNHIDKSHCSFFCLGHRGWCGLVY